MQERIITIYCLCDEVLKADGFVDLPGTAMSTAEVMTTALVAADLFGGCFERIPLLKVWLQRGKEEIEGREKASLIQKISSEQT